MNIDGEQVYRLRKDRGLSFAEVAAAMRRHEGAERTQAGFVAMAERDLWTDARWEWVAALAAALGSDVVTVSGGRHLRLVRP